MQPKVKLVAYTKPVVEGVETPEDFVAYAARVSNPSNQNNSATAAKLLKYLINNEHWSPLEMVHVVMEINTTRDIARQILRHRSFSFQEFSQRYADASSLGFEYKECRMQDTKNRQNSTKTEDKLLANWWEDAQKCVAEYASLMYTRAIDYGIAKEQARAVLPEGITKSRLYMSGTLRSWLHYCLLRKANGTQAEHMEIAIEALNILTTLFPAIVDIVNEEPIS